MTQIIRTYWNLITVLILSIAGVWIGFSAFQFRQATGGKIPAPHQGFPAPDFSAKTLAGNEYVLSSLRGKIILVNIWASWCLPCRKEMPALEKVYQDYAKKGFIVLAVNTTNQDRLNEVKGFTEELDLTFPILLDENGTISEMYQVSALPTSFFISADGIIQDVIIGGPMSEALLRSRVEHLFNLSQGELP